MCEHCDISVYTKAKKIDPTRTVPLSREWDKDFKRRFLVIRKALKEAVIDNDVFGLAEPQMMTLAATSTPRMFAFQTSAAKVDAFMKWFQQQVSDNLLTVRQIGNAGALPWTNLYVEDSYKRGIERGRAELAKAGFNVPTMQATGGVETAVWGRVHAEKLGLLYTRTYNDLKGITNQMDTQISRVLTQAMADGDSPRTIWRKMNAVITGGGGDLGITDTLGRYIPAERRAAMIARTEVIRAHHAATINEYRSWGAEGVNVQAEWSTAGFDVCEECEELQGKIFSLDEIESMIPVHPNCRCLALPYLPEEAEASTVEDAVAVESGFENVSNGIDMTSIDFTSDSNVLKDIINEPAINRLSPTKYEDNWLKVAAEKQGYSHKPVQMDAANFDEYAGEVLFRGTTGGNEYVKQFIDGDYFGGVGSTGNGYYFASGSKNVDEAFSLAKEYAGGNIEGVLEAKLMKGAKVVEWGDLQFEHINFEGSKKLGYSYLKEQLRNGTLTEKQFYNITEVFHDPGRYACLKGYDAIRVSDSYGIDYIVVLNRSKIIVKKVS